MPLLLANIQPERSVTAEWDMDDLTYNQGIHGAQDQANALVRRGRPVLGASPATGARSSSSAVRGLGAAAQTVTALRRREDRAARLSDERDGRHPLRPAGDAAPARADDRQRGPRRAGRAHEAVSDDGRRRAARGAPRASSRCRPTCPASATRTRRGSSSRSAGCSRTAATTGSRSTSTRSAATAASSSCRCWPPRT